MSVQSSTVISFIIIIIIIIIITVCTVVQNCCKGDSPCQWNTPSFRPMGSKTPEPIDIKFDRGDYVGDITPHANFGIFIPKGGAVVHMREIVIIRVYFLHPRYFFIPVEVALFDRF